MENVFFYPVVGKYYDTKGFNGIKLLILGESHYCEEQCTVCGIKSNINCSKFTIDVMSNYFDYKKGIGEHEYWMTTFTKFTNVLLEEKTDSQTLLDFWDSVIFYNYLQFTTSGPRISPTNEQFNESQIAFFEILEEYKPDIVIAWGKRLWDSLPNNGWWGEENILDNANGQFYYYKIENENIPVYHIYHPSTQYFNYEYSKYIKEAIRIIKNNKLKEKIK